MKIVYIHQYFKTPGEGGAIRSYHFAKKLAEKGFEVEVATSHNCNRYREARVEGFKVHYLPVRYENAFGFTGRIYSFLKFVFRAYRLISRIEGISLIYATSTPLTVGWLALQLKKRKKIPYVFEVRDLWPDAPVEMGAIRNPLLKNFLSGLERRIYAGSLSVVALSPPVRDTIKSRCPGKTVHLLPNFSDMEYFKPASKDEKLLNDLQIGSDFVVVYFGAIGKANQVISLLHLAEVCRGKRENIKFLIIGEGAELKNLKTYASKMGLRNVIFIPSQSKAGLKLYLDISHAAYISFDKPRILETCSPNKFFDALAAGKLILYNKNGWIRELIERNACGFYADPLLPNQTYENLKNFITDRQKLKSYQENALATGRFFSKEKILEGLMKIVEGLIKE